MAVGFPDVPTFDVRKAALLRASLGTEGFRLYCSFTPEAELRESYDTAVAARLRKHALRTASERHLRSRAVHPMSTASRLVRHAVCRRPREMAD